MFNENQSDLSGFSLDDYENDEIEEQNRNNVSGNEPTDAAESDDHISLASLARVSNQVISYHQGQAKNEPAQRVYSWRKRDTILRGHLLLEEFFERPLEDMTPQQYFSVLLQRYCQILLLDRLTFIVFQTIHKTIGVKRAEIMSLTLISIKMGILQLPSYKLYQSREFRCRKIVDFMPCKRCQELLRIRMSWLKFVP